MLCACVFFTLYLNKRGFYVPVLLLSLGDAGVKLVSTSLKFSIACSQKLNSLCSEIIWKRKWFKEHPGYNSFLNREVKFTQGSFGKCLLSFVLFSKLS